MARKRQDGSFCGTELDQNLRRRGVKTIVPGAHATNLGVERRARAAQERGCDLLFGEIAEPSRAEAMNRFAVETILPLRSRVRTVAEIVAGFKK